MSKQWLRAGKKISAREIFSECNRSQAKCPGYSPCNAEPFFLAICAEKNLLDIVKPKKGPQ